MAALYPSLSETGPDDTADVPNNALILHDGEHVTLLDTGLPADPGGSTEAPMFDALRQLGFAPADVDTVIITHLHPDHIGPLLVHEPSASPFPNAHFYLHDEERAYFSDEANLTRHRGRVADAVRIALPVLSRSRVTLFGEPLTPLPGLTIRPAAGHTPGHCVVDIGTPPTCVYIADLVAHQRQLDQPELASGFDQDSQRARDVRVTELADIRRRGVGIIGSHLD